MWGAWPGTWCCSSCLSVVFHVCVGFVTSCARDHVVVITVKVDNGFMSNSCHVNFVVKLAAIFIAKNGCYMCSLVCGTEQLVNLRRNVFQTCASQFPRRFQSF